MVSQYSPETGQSQLRVKGNGIQTCTLSMPITLNHIPFLKFASISYSQPAVEHGMPDRPPYVDNTASTAQQVFGLQFREVLDLQKNTAFRIVTMDLHSPQRIAHFLNFGARIVGMLNVNIIERDFVTAFELASEQVFQFW